MQHSKRLECRSGKCLLNPIGDYIHKFTFDQSRAGVRRGPGVVISPVFCHGAPYGVKYHVSLNGSNLEHPTDGYRLTAGWTAW